MKTEATTSKSPTSTSSTPKSSKTTTTFYVLRHGETDMNAAGIVQGSSDVSRLTATGRSQAEAVGYMALSQIADGLSNERCCIDQIYVSPLTRCHETLALLRENAPANLKLPKENVVLWNLREIDFYSWECKTKEEIQKEHPKEYEAFQKGDPDGLVVDGHQPLHEVWERAGEVWRDIRAESSSNQQNSTKLLVCHGTLGQALLGSAFGKDAHAFRDHPFGNCQMAEITWHDDEELATSWRWLEVCQD